MAEPKYGSFDGIASRYDEREAWVLHDGWVPINHSSHGNAVSELTKQEFDQLFPDAPPLPDRAFKA
jgi:hypothetical protein